MKLGVDVNRHKEVIVKAISAVLLLLLKHFKLNHVYQVPPGLPPPCPWPRPGSAALQPGGAEALTFTALELCTDVVTRSPCRGLLSREEDRGDGGPGAC